MSNCTTLKYVLIILLFMNIFVQRTNRAGVEFHADAVRIIAVGNTCNCTAHQVYYNCEFFKKINKHTMKKNKNINNIKMLVKY